jgi:HK97 family phage major capsid protein
MDVDTELNLKRELKDKAKRLGDLMDRVASGDTSRRVRAELTTITNEIAELRKRVPPFDPRQGRGGRGDDEASTQTLKPEQRMADWVREHGGGYTASDAVHGLGDDPERCSLGRMVRGAITGNWQNAELEQRALSESVLASGVYLVPTPLAGTMIDRVRNAARVFQAGATTVPMTAQTLKLARLAGGQGVSWKAEGDAVTGTDMTFEPITLSAKTLPVLVKLSVELADDMTEEGSNLIEHEIAQALSLELDRAALRGSGSGTGAEPQGVRNQSGVTITSLGASGATPNWDHVIDGASTVRNANIEPSAILWASRTEQTFGKYKLSTGEYMPPPPTLAGVSRLTTNQLPVNLTVGSSSDCSEIMIGRWSDLLVGIRTDLRFEVRVLNERFIDSGQYGLWAYLRADVQLAHPASFTVLTGVRP